jgi:hypothetical protein
LDILKRFVISLLKIFGQASEPAANVVLDGQLEELSDLQRRPLKPNAHSRQDMVKVHDKAAQGLGCTQHRQETL